MKKRILVALLVAASLLPLACSHDALETGGAPNEGEQTGVLRAALGGNGPTHDVASFEYVVVHANQSCSDPPIAVRSVPLQPEPLPPSGLLPNGGGAQHPFADVFFVLPPGQYLVCATPFRQSGGHSNECSQASTTAMVAPGVTTEIVLVSQCTGQSNGAIDGITILNDPPVIDSLNIIPNKFITACQTANLIVQATDPNGDALTTVWTVTSPTGNTTTFNGSLLIFSPRGQTGDFEVHVTVSDPFGASTSLTLTMHVLPCDPPDGGAGNG
jgi:hypothetical protein